jgi:uncharacterized protein DUF4160
LRAIITDAERRRQSPHHLMPSLCAAICDMRSARKNLRQDATAMPTIAWFYGIAIRMYVRDHPPPHFHAIYGEHEAFIAIETGEVIEGGLPKTAGRLVKEWTLARRDQLRENWRRARAGEQPERIAGLDAD